MIYSGLKHTEGKNLPISTHRTKSAPHKQIKSLAVSQDARNLDIALHHVLTLSPPDWQAAQVKQARRAFEQEHFAQALSTLSKLPEASQHTLSVLTLYAEIYTAQEDDEQALTYYRYLLEHTQDFTEITPLDRLRMQGLTHMNMGWNLQRMQRYLEAKSSYSEAIEILSGLRALKTESIFTSLMVAYQQRSQVHRYLNEYEASLSDLKYSVIYQQQLIERDVREHMVKDWLEIGRTQLEQGQLNAATESLAAARKDWMLLQLDEAEILLIPLQLFEIDLARARQDFSAVAAGYQKLKDRFKGTLQNVHYSLLQIEALFTFDTERAVALCETLIPELTEREEHHERHLLVLPLLAAAELCEGHEEYALALTYYQFTLRFASQTASENYWLEACAGRARMLEACADFRRAITAYRDLLRHLENRSAANSLAERMDFTLKLALCYQQSEKWKEAETQFNWIIEQNDESSSNNSVTPNDFLIRALYFRGFMFAVNLQDTAAAIQDFEHIESLVPGYAAYDLACLLTQQKDFDRAFMYLTEHLKSAYVLESAEILADKDLKLLMLDPRWQAQVVPLMP